MGDPNGVHETAHRLKGACKQLGLIAMAEICQGLEDRGRSDNLQGCEEWITILEHRFLQTKEILKEKYTLLEV
jgi:HPt (histidine-containing phosphotransfer) domain-containing protein